MFARTTKSIFRAEYPSLKKISPKSLVTYLLWWFLFLSISYLVMLWFNAGSALDSVVLSISTYSFQGEGVSAFQANAIYVAFIAVLFGILYLTIAVLGSLVLAIHAAFLWLLNKKKSFYETFMFSVFSNTPFFLVIGVLWLLDIVLMLTASFTTLTLVRIMYLILFFGGWGISVYLRMKWSKAVLSQSKWRVSIPDVLCLVLFIVLVLFV